MNPLEALSPTIIAQLRHPQDPTPAERAKNRGRVRRQVLGCTDCELHHGGTPVVFNGSPRPRFVVVGDVPGTRDAKLGRPGIGPSGKLLRELMRDVGIDPDDALWCNVVSCQTERASKDETLACRGNLLDQVEVACVPFVLFVGAKALGAFRSDLTVTHNHGQVFVWNDLYMVTSIIHPEAIIKGQSGFKPVVRGDLQRWRDVVYSGDNPTLFLGDKCFKCHGQADMWDRDGVPMCLTHWAKWKNQWEKERRRWSEAPAIQLTF